MYSSTTLSEKKTSTFSYLTSVVEETSENY